MTPLKEGTAEPDRPEPFPDLDNEPMPADAFDLWDEGAVDDLAHISQQFAREVDGVDPDAVPPGFSVPNIWR